MMSPEQEQEQLDELARVIKQRTEAAFEELMTRLQAGEDPRAAMEAVTSQFHGQYYDELSAAFSTVLDRAIGSADIRSLPVSDVALSERLYRHTAEVNTVTRQIIKDHVKGFTQARELAMQIYEGYGFKDDPLKVQVNLPKYLREALQDPAISQGFAQIAGRIRADNLKTPALKAAYLQAIDALEAGAGGNRLKKLMQTAWFERNRYFANRIAQTELHRAYSNQAAQEIMADEATVWVKYQMSKTHPKVDICDRHAGMNGWGKGPGIYPKAQAPKPPAHPFCRCTVRPAYEVEGEPGKPVKDAEQRFMNRLSDYDQRLIAGSRDRLQQFRDGKPLEAIYNEGKNPIYRWGRVGDTVSLNRQFRQPSGEFTAYDDGYPIVKPDTSTPLKKSVITFEDAYRNKTDLETGAFFNDDGSFALGPKTGKPDRVSFFVADLQRMAGKVYSHNHPMGASFSPQDVELAAEYGFAEIRAVTKLFRHSLSAATWPTIDEIRKAVKEEERRVEIELEDQIKTGQIRAIHYGFELTHRTWARVAMRLAMKYVREKS